MGSRILRKSLIWYSSELLFGFFLTEACGFSPTEMGTALMISLVFGGILDVVVGQALTKWVNSIRTAGNWQFPAALATAVTLVAFAATPMVLSEVRTAYIIATSLLFRLAYAFYDNPENAMLSLATAQGSGQMRLSATRFFAAGIASLLVAAAAAPVLMSDKVADRASNFLIYAVVLASINGLSSWALRLVCDRLPASTPQAVDVIRVTATGKRTRLVVPALLLFIYAFTSAVFGKLEPYLAAEALSSTVSRMSVLMFISAGGIVSQFPWVWLAGRTSQRTAFRASAAMMAIGASLFLLGGRSNPWTAGFAGMVLGCGGGGIAMLLWAAIAAAISGQAGRSGSIGAPFAFGFVSGSIKLASALSILVVGQILAQFNCHDSKVVTSWMFLLPKAGTPLLGALVCLMSAPIMARRVGVAPARR